jgi:hypothetical protein
MPEMLHSGNDSVRQDDQIKEITDFDFCDKCGARAKARAHKNDLELYFCGHHADLFFNMLTDQDFYIYYPS